MDAVVVGCAIGASVLMGWMGGALWGGRKRLADLRNYQEYANDQWADFCVLLADVATALASGKRLADTEAVADAPEIGEGDIHPVQKPGIVARMERLMFGDPPMERSAAADLDGFYDRQATMRAESEAVRKDGEAAARAMRRQEMDERNRERPLHLSTSSISVLGLLADGKPHTAREMAALPGTSIGSPQSAAAIVSVLRSKLKSRSITIEGIRGQGYRISSMTLPAERALLDELSGAPA